MITALTSNVNEWETVKCLEQHLAKWKHLISTRVTAAAAAAEEDDPAAPWGPGQDTDLGRHQSLQNALGAAGNLALRKAEQYLKP